MVRRANRAKARRRWFVDRQFLLRSETGVRQIRVSRRDQILALAVASGVAFWAVATSVSTAMFAVHQMESAETIEHLEMGYAQLVSRLSRSGAQTRELVEEMPQIPTLGQRLVAHNNLLATRVDELEQSLAGAEAERNALAVALAQRSDELNATAADLAASRDALTMAQADSDRHAQAADLAEVSRDEALVQLREARAQRTRELRRAEEAEARAEDLGHRVDELSVAVRSASRTVATVADERDALETERDELADELADAQDQVLTLAADLEDARTLMGSMTTSQDGQAAELQQMADRLAEAEADLAAAQLRIDGLEDGLEFARLNAGALAWSREALTVSNAELAGRAQRLDDELDTLRNVQGQFVADLQDRLAQQVDGMHMALASTGLDVDEMMADLHMDPDGAYGGPLVPELPDYLLGHDGWTAAADVLALADEVSGLTEVADALPLGRPAGLDTRLSSGFGTRRDPFTGRTARHEGLDFAGSYGAPVYATAPGTVLVAGWQGAYGRMVEIQHPFGLITRYAHLSSVSVNVGDVVGYGEQVGTLGSSGRSTGPHLHYEVRVEGTPRDPMSFLRAGYDVLEVTDAE
ncbi:MAG: peptidoglycan DD-metalloendopeptidase family protein [Rhodospirillaceae bacterium]|nr:peptidoglycan DD-metalloendopeptidase family protein [Rhodospirillaceae bacterium]MCA8933958.1 peptidoglycan DD-metalloendopeptidase family protein [Rhodospirillaceae bacterium]